MAFVFSGSESDLNLIETSPSLLSEILKCISIQKDGCLFLSHYSQSVDHSNSLLRVLTNWAAMCTAALIH